MKSSKYVKYASGFISVAFAIPAKIPSFVFTSSQQNRFMVVKKPSPWPAPKGGEGIGGPGCHGRLSAMLPLVPQLWRYRKYLSRSWTAI